MSKERRPDGPFAVLDDSLSIFPADSQGIIGEANLDEFFCIVDTENGDNSGPVSAEWAFDISGYSALELAIDIGAMGDFEVSNDFFTIEASIDGGPAELLFASTVEEAGNQDYTMDGGATFNLNDPMLLDGVLLNTGIAHAADPIGMAKAMRLACESGRLAALSGRIPKKLYATASSPTSGRPACCATWSVTPRRSCATARPVSNPTGGSFRSRALAIGGFTRC